MTLTYEEQIKVEIEKIKKLKRKMKNEEAKKKKKLGEMLLQKFPDISVDNFELVMEDFLYSGVSEEKQANEKLGKLFMKRMPRYFNINQKDRFDDVVNKLATYVEQNE